MLTEPLIQQLHQLRLTGMAAALEQQLSHYGTTGSRFARRGLRFGSGKNRGAEPHTNGSRP
jgi:hypothetical protein